MKETNEFRYRIIYEALSLFSSRLSKCESFESISDCLFKNMKYILDYHLFRLSFYHHDGIMSYTICNKQCRLEKNQTKLWKLESQFFDVSIPKLFEADNDFKNDLNSNHIALNEEPKDIWGWNFQLQNNCGILVTLATNNETKFTKSDVPVLKLVVENLSSKLLSLKLIEELDIKKQQLEQVNKDLTATNEMISKIVSEQDELIEQRTAEIKQKNRRLLHISKHNAHNVREPLSRIMGILMLIEQEKNYDTINECLPLLYKSSNDLNRAINITVKYVDDQILKNKKYEAANHAC